MAVCKKLQQCSEAQRTWSTLKRKNLSYLLFQLFVVFHLSLLSAIYIFAVGHCRLYFSYCLREIADLLVLKRRLNTKKMSKMLSLWCEFALIFAFALVTTSLNGFWKFELKCWQDLACWFELFARAANKPSQ